MSIIKYFMFPAARRRYERRERRHAFRDAENAKQDVIDRQKRLEAESKESWEKAREALKKGERAAANRALTAARAAQVLAMKLEQKRWVFEQYLTKMEVAQSDNQFAEALGAINKIIRIDPEHVEDVFGAAQDMLGEQVDADRFWNKMYENEMAGANGAFQDRIPSFDDMASELERQVAEETSGGSSAAAGNESTSERNSGERRREKDSGAVQAEGDGEGGPSFEVAEVPNVSFDDIAGMDDAKAAIMEMVVYPMREPEKSKAMKLKPGGGVILYGPPGNGKTMFGKAIAHEIAAPFFYASGAQIRSKWHGESEQNLSRLLKAAASRPVAVLFLDEIDGLLPRRTAGASVVDNRIVTQFLADVGGFRESDNTLLILGATNKPWAIDEAVFRTGRFDEKLYIGLPDLEARRGMLRQSLGGVAREGNFAVEPWAERLDGYTGSDIVGLTKKARQIAFRRSIEAGGTPVVREADMEAALKVIPSSVTPQMLRQYEEFNKQRF